MRYGRSIMLALTGIAAIVISFVFRYNYGNVGNVDFVMPLHYKGKVYEETEDIQNAAACASINTRETARTLSEGFSYIFALGGFTLIACAIPSGRKAKDE